MKRIFVILSMIVMLLFVSCKAVEPVADSAVNEQMQISEQGCEAMLVKIRTIESEGYFGASVIDSNGDYHALPESFSFADEDWRQTLMDAIESEPKNSVEQRHLERMREFVDDFAASAGYEIKSYEHTVWDYGSSALYVIYTNSNGDAAYKLLCRYGEATQCIDKDNVRDFVNWMIENRYFQVASSEFRY